MKCSILVIINPKVDCESIFNDSVEKIQRYLGERLISRILPARCLIELVTNINENDMKHIDKEILPDCAYALFVEISDDHSSEEPILISIN